MIVLDTHVFLWMTLEPERIPDSILDAIQAESFLGLAAISLWEAAMLSNRGRIEPPDRFLPWLRRALSLPKINPIRITPEIADRSESLDMHGDPADRLIAAASLAFDSPLATVDSKLVSLPFIRTVT